MSVIAELGSIPFILIGFLLLLLWLLLLLLLLLLLAFPLPSCLRHKGYTQRSSLAGRSGWQLPCVLEANARLVGHESRAMR
jgi:hypothetical protein